MKEIIVAPSILSLDYANVSEQLQILKESKAEWLHFDVMDGHFVKNLTFGPDILKGFKKATKMFMDVHIMVEDPSFVAKLFIEAGADMLTFHLEAINGIEECIALCKWIRKQGVQAGVSVKPNTNIEELLPHLKEIDMILIMSVEPGFGGQSFMAHTLEKVQLLRKEIDRYGYDLKIEIDGGINDQTAPLAVQAGCDVLVAGSYIFKGDIEKNIDRLLLCQK
ncbi:MAG: ribulose-phosphate 3-epimerase [Erysipelotrichaceae bacterium]|nr:ribulose-phosphate 3-epimerase [Erysipelotrichaceae bacterium]